MTLKIVRYGAWVAVAVLAFFVAVGSVLWYQEQSRSGAMVASIGGDFSLVDGNGKRVSEADFLGKPRAMFFGFTHCPEVCPTTLYEASGWIKALGSDAGKLSFLFVTVDPERDTPDVMRDYVAAFDGTITGLTGSREEIEAVVKAYRVFARKVELENGDYTMDHSASIYLIDGKGRFAGTISHTEEQDAAVEKLRKLIAEG